MGSTDLPWMRIPGLKCQPTGQVRCQVISVSNKFPSINATYLIDRFGDHSSDVTQEHNIITYIELEILDPLP